MVICTLVLVALFQSSLCENAHNRAVLGQQAIIEPNPIGQQALDEPSGTDHVTVDYETGEEDAYDPNDTEDIAKRVLSKCFEDLGCFTTDKDFFHPILRPFRLLPADREAINTKFLLYTRKNIKQYNAIRAKDSKSIESSNFDPELETKFIVHGYLDNQLFGEWMRNMKTEFLMHGDYNIILIDWSGGNGLPYAQASANTRLVGAEVAFLIAFLKENFGLKPEKVHILGHSLGAHVAGYAGERTAGMARITAMDPAEPFFQGLPEKVRIDPSDATFVDVIHTDAKSILLLGLGMNDLVGHVDFFPNNGNEHPGCDKATVSSIITAGLAEGARRFVSCNHQRSVDFMADSINNVECEMVGLACHDWETFSSGSCTSCGAHGEKCAILGLRSIENNELVAKYGSQGKMFFKTAAKSPFCVFHYQITFRLDTKGSSRDGYVTVTLKGRKRDVIFELGEKDINMIPGSSYTFLVETQRDLGEIDAVNFEWKRRNGGLIPEIIKRTIYLDHVHVQLITRMKEGDPKKVWNFCNKELNPIENKRKITLLKKDKC